MYIKKIIKKLPQRLRTEIIEYKFFLKAKTKRYNKILKNYSSICNQDLMKIDDIKKWTKKLEKITYSNLDLIEVGKAFFTSEINILKNIDMCDKKVIAICVVKDDLIRLKRFIYHHRSIGIKQFVILDNNSTDGSVEWLLKQPDVAIMQTKVPYSTNNREGWINRIMAFYGDERWYFVADSDELLVYEKCEEKDIEKLIDYLKSKNIIRARALMLDMYAKPEYYEKGDIKNYYSECVYFDYNTYNYLERDMLSLICGGPRERLFNQSPWLTKYPLFYLRKQDIECKSHFLFPFRENLNCECNLVLKHYKFLPGDIEKYKEIVRKENYFNGSKQYKQYLKVMEITKNLDFICDSTKKYCSSNDLNNICIYDGIKWD